LGEAEQPQGGGGILSGKPDVIKIIVFNVTIAYNPKPHHCRINPKRLQQIHTGLRKSQLPEHNFCFSSYREKASPQNDLSKF